MITPGFFGFYNAHRGLVATQNALNTVSHNISNANTAGYSRQRVDLEAYTPYTTPNMHQLIGGQLGQGPWVQQVTRSRDVFLDAQYRSSNGTLGLDTAIRDALQQVEGILTEPSVSGINSAIQNFFDSAQELSLHPESMAVRANYIQQAIDMVNVFQQQGLQLSDLRRNLVGDPAVAASLDTSQLAISVNDVNTLLGNIAAINRSIISVKASGAQPNDLMDQRDKLLDELSNLVDIEVTNYDNGQIDLSIGGQTMIRSADQVDSLEVVVNPNAPPGPPIPTYDDVPAFVQTVNGGVVLNNGAGAEITAGRIKGISDMGGNDPNLSTVRGVMEKLDALLDTIVTQVNLLQQTGRDITGALGPPDIFFNDPALNPTETLNLFHWRVTQSVITDPGEVAAAIDDATAPGGFAGVGDGRNALNMAQLRDQTFAALGTTFIDYFNGITSKLGIDTRSYQNTSSSQEGLVQAVDLRRQSVSGVNVDEEMIDMLRYQRAFEATSKTIQMFDDVIKTILSIT
jgi:flagellar hook-associated protein 1 FlgK